MWPEYTLLPLLWDQENCDSHLALFEDTSNSSAMILEILQYFSL